MRIANLSDRLVVIDGEQAIDVERASDGRFSADPQAVFERFGEFREWIDGGSPGGGEAYDVQQLGPPVPRPRQVFAIGLNYRDHADEVGLPVDDVPPVFTKFPSCLAGPHAEVPHPGGDVDWEVELVVAIGRPGQSVALDDAWSHVAGLTVGQDISERVLQHAGTLPQFSLGKSYPGCGPTGPWLVTPDELDDPDDLELGCSVNGEVVQQSSTARLLRSVPQLIARLSAVTPLFAGDLIFTGTPSGVGLGHTPPRFLSVGDEVVTRIAGIGELRNRIVADESVRA
jgi:2-keto-4-pentenoate hydratase/2-oxohepta-3-ene-1,7-dioic acid hydratase in catechol pathway